MREIVETEIKKINEVRDKNFDMKFAALKAKIDLLEIKMGEVKGFHARISGFFITQLVFILCTIFFAGVWYSSVNTRLDAITANMEKLSYSPAPEILKEQITLYREEQKRTEEQLRILSDKIDKVIVAHKK